MTEHIFIDANFLLVPVQLKIDIYREFENLVPKPYELIVISAVFRELNEKIASLPPTAKFRREHRFALQLLERNNFREIKSERKEHQLVDDLILEEAIKDQNAGNDVYIATNDKELRGKCRNHRIRSIFIRKQQFLATD
ncbi:MAG: type II toxin-antitoxin system VapC family toxin [Promethearchaeota archaeon]